MYVLSMQGEIRFAHKYKSTGPADALTFPQLHMVPVALVAKFTPVLGGLAREVLDGLSTSPAGGIAPAGEVVPAKL